LSVIRQQKTDINDQESLQKSLEDLGHKVTVNATPEKIRGHYNELSKEKCELVVRKEDSGRQADIGFHKTDDGTFQVITDTWVNRDLSDLGKFTNEIKAKYLVHQAKRIARKQGYNYLGTKTVNGKTIVRMSVNA
jgi:hypothetical protein